MVAITTSSFTPSIATLLPLSFHLLLYSLNNGKSGEIHLIPMQHFAEKCINNIGSVILLEFYFF